MMRRMPELIDPRVLLLQHRLHRSKRVAVEIEWDAREEVMDEVEVLEHVESVHERLGDAAEEPVAPSR